ncbi:MAG: hypothetical protein WCB00_24310 [Candidatus Acidiferrales bacterium]
MKELPPKLRASDALNWDYLVKIAEQSQEDATNLREGLAAFAYNFTSTADEDSRDVFLTDLLNNATAYQSTDTAEKIVKLLANSLQTDHERLRQFGKENGVRLKRG